MIRDVVLHLLNEQPLVADLEEVPAPGDVSLVCTNLRTMGRKRPIFVDHAESTFVFPYSQIRFVEIPATREARPGEPAALSPGDAAAGTDLPDEIELDEELLRRVREL